MTPANENETMTKYLAGGFVQTERPRS